MKLLSFQHTRRSIIFRGQIAYIGFLGSGAAEGTTLGGHTTIWMSRVGSIEPSPLLQMNIIMDTAMVLAKSRSRYREARIPLLPLCTLGLILDFQLKMYAFTGLRLPKQLGTISPPRSCALAIARASDSTCRMRIAGRRTITIPFFSGRVIFPMCSPNTV